MFLFTKVVKGKHCWSEEYATFASDSEYVLYHLLPYWASTGQVGLKTGTPSY